MASLGFVVVQCLTHPWTCHSPSLRPSWSLLLVSGADARNNSDSGLQTRGKTTNTPESVELALQRNKWARRKLRNCQVIMQRLPALARALESFGFDEQSSLCVRVFEFGSTAFKDQSLQWQQWAVNAQENGEKNASFDDYDSWMRCRSAALSAWDKLALPMPCPPPLLFDSLAENTPAPGNSLTKVCKSPFLLMRPTSTFSLSGPRRVRSHHVLRGVLCGQGRARPAYEPHGLKSEQH